MSQCTDFNPLRYCKYGDFYVVGANKTLTLNSPSSTSNLCVPSLGVSGTITIQESINGIPVKEIGYFAFYACSLITEVVIKARINQINYGSFCYCHKLESINIPSSCHFIGEWGIWLGGSSWDRALGTITVVFEGEPNNVHLMSNSIDGKETIIISFYGRRYLSFTGRQLVCQTNLLICAPYIDSFCGFPTTKLDSRCPFHIPDKPINVPSKQLKHSYYHLILLITTTSSSSLIS